MSRYATDPLNRIILTHEEYYKIEEFICLTLTSTYGVTKSPARRWSNVQGPRSRRGLDPASASGRWV
ncbi:hypothetical protein EVAR_98307_1 [Eumeta japonica]|uniref:Uncharacterized protein n=1 Tax=Eumeta variegata TaxID=151549 RepID=A0A4C1X9C2_EUMVA|nr:hypothetical protein EVAR_98307_1 [Eumeta japonica]